jgi:signal transduction histidine kinase
LSHSRTLPAPPAVADRRLLAAAFIPALLILVAATIAGLAVGRLMVPMSTRDLVGFFVVLAASLSGTTVAGLVALTLIDRSSRLTIAARTFAGVAIGALVALANVMITSALMFINTTHDLGLTAALVVAGSGVILLFALRLAHATSREVEPLRVALHQLAAGSFDAVALPRGRTAEFAALAADIERLRDQLQQVEADRDRLDAERRELTASISHDLRTPLGSIRAMAEALDDGVVSEDEERSAYYRQIHRETERLSRMIDELFELARIDAGALELERHPVPLQDIAAEVVDAMRPLAREAGVLLDLEIAGSPPPAELDGALMERAIGNLVRNALEHTPSGQAVNVRVAASPRGVRLAVHNSGSVIATAELDRVWDRFYRGEPSRARLSRGGADGAGLGLAIVKGIVETHGGTATVESSSEDGTTFTVCLPRPVAIATVH